jgi:hypothetical protein
MDVLQWADRVADRVQKMTGLKPFLGPQRRMRLVVGDLGPATNAVTARQVFDGGQLVQEVCISDYTTADIRSTERALCRVLLEGYVVVGDGKPGPDGASRSRPFADVTRFHVPDWLVEGFARNLKPDVRARDSELVLTAWQGGLLLPLSVFLRTGHLVNPRTVAADPAWAGSLTGQLVQAHSAEVVDWLSSQPEQEAFFRSLFELLAGSGPVTPEGLAGSLPGCTGVADLEDRWEQWLVGQKRTIFVPGQTTRRGLEQLRGHLLLYPEESGMPPQIGRYQPVDFQSLIGLRDQPWVARATRERIEGLQRLAVGRSEPFQAVAAGYCEFLSRLASGAGEEELRECLRRAQEAQSLLEHEWKGAARESEPLSGPVDESGGSVERGNEKDDSRQDR